MLLCKRKVMAKCFSNIREYNAILVVLAVWQYFACRVSVLSRSPFELLLVIFCSNQMISPAHSRPLVVS